MVLLAQNSIEPFHIGAEEGDHSVHLRSKGASIMGFGLCLAAACMPGFTITSLLEPQPRIDLALVQFLQREVGTRDA
jgi:hypothetical protein